MFPGPFYPPSVYPGSLFPGSGKGASSSGSSGSSGLVGLYPPSLFAPALFPESLFPGVAPPVTPPEAPFVFDLELADWLATVLPCPCFPNRIPQDRSDYPLMAYTLVDGDSEQKLSGPNGLAWRNYQFDAYSLVYADAATLLETLRQALQGYRGPMGRAKIQVSSLHRPQNNYEAAVDGSDDGIVRITNEYTLWYVEPKPACAT